jgi:hypothetical protein
MSNCRSEKHEASGEVRTGHRKKRVKIYSNGRPGKQANIVQDEKENRP